MNLEDVFCSKIRMRILKLLFKLGQLNTSDLAHRLGTNYATTLRHLSLLKREGVIAEKVERENAVFSLHEYVESAGSREAVGRVGGITDL